MIAYRIRKMKDMVGNAYLFRLAPPLIFEDKSIEYVISSAIDTDADIDEILDEEEAAVYPHQWETAVFAATDNGDRGHELFALTSRAEGILGIPSHRMALAEIGYEISEEEYSP